MPGTEAPVAVDVKRQALKDASDVSDSITPALQHLELVVETLDKVAGLVVDEGVGDQILPAVEQRQEGIEAGQPALGHPLSPERDAPQPVGLGAGSVEDAGQFLTQGDRLFERRAMDEAAIELLLLGGLEVVRALA